MTATPPRRSPWAWWQHLGDPAPPGQRGLVVVGGFALLLFLEIQVGLDWIGPVAYLVLVPLAVWVLGWSHRRRQR